jgi:hypothetical protein
MSAPGFPGLALKGLQRGMMWRSLFQLRQDFGGARAVNGLPGGDGPRGDRQARLSMGAPPTGICHFQFRSCMLKIQMQIKNGIAFQFYVWNSFCNGGRLFDGGRSREVDGSS